MLIPSRTKHLKMAVASLSRRVNANSQLENLIEFFFVKLIKKGEC